MIEQCLEFSISYIARLMCVSPANATPVNALIASNWFKCVSYLQDSQKAWNQQKFNTFYSSPSPVLVLVYSYVQ